MLQQAATSLHTAPPVQFAATLAWSSAAQMAHLRCCLQAVTERSSGRQASQRLEPLSPPPEGGLAVIQRLDLLAQELQAQLQRVHSMSQQASPAGCVPLLETHALGELVLRVQ